MKTTIELCKEAGFPLMSFEGVTYVSPELERLVALVRADERAAPVAKDEALKLALEALEYAASCVQSNYMPDKGGHDWDEVMDTLRTAIEQAEKQEPHSWYSAEHDEWMTDKTRKEHERLNSYTHKVGGFDLPLYTTPPAQPAPVQPMAHIVGEIDHAGKVWKPAPVRGFVKKIEDLIQERDDALSSLDFYKRRVDALQQWQSKMRDPERTVVCDIIANGRTLEPAGDRYTTPPAAQRQHVTDGSPCWCEPETSYTDPETGASVIVHKEPQ